MFLFSLLQVLGLKEQARLHHWCQLKTGTQRGRILFPGILCLKTQKKCPSLIEFPTNFILKKITQPILCTWGSFLARHKEGIRKLCCKVCHPAGQRGIENCRPGDPNSTPHGLSDLWKMASSLLSLCHFICEMRGLNFVISNLPCSSKSLWFWNNLE